MNEKECEVCAKMVKEKYKYYKMWRNLAIIFICLTFLLAILLVANGDLFVKETIENNIIIDNASSENENNIVTGNGSTISGTIERESNIGVIIIVCVAILTGGIIYGSYIVSQKKSDK